MGGVFPEGLCRTQGPFPKFFSVLRSLQSPHSKGVEAASSPTPPKRNIVYNLASHKCQGKEKKSEVYIKLNFGFHKPGVICTVHQEDDPIDGRQVVLPHPAGWKARDQHLP